MNNNKLSRADLHTHLDRLLDDLDRALEALRLPKGADRRYSSSAFFVEHELPNGEGAAVVNTQAGYGSPDDRFVFYRQCAIMILRDELHVEDAEDLVYGITGSDADDVIISITATNKKKS